MTKKAHIIILVLVLVFATFIRFYQLGYSHFYGDETKTLFVRKDVSAFNFLMGQRKGPMQFLLTWSVEKVSGGFAEGDIRFPFAVVGTALVLVFYIFVRQNFGESAALFSTFLFSLNGLYIAFSRTAQYQVLYLLFGFLCLILAKQRKVLIAGLVFSMALLSHYDATFFLIPLFFLTERKSFLKITGIGLLISAIFYLPNIALGFFGSNTFAYVARRISGINYQRNSSLLTVAAYNPLYVYITSLATFSIIGALKVQNVNKKLLLIWFFTPFVVFQLVILNPGTHIHNYLIPIVILAGAGADFVMKKFVRYKIAFIVLTSILFITIAVVQAWVYVPMFNTGYPWKNTSFLGLSTKRVTNDYHLYLYGFPYYRSWDKIGKLLSAQNSVRNFYTNENETVAEYYMRGPIYRLPELYFRPQYYILISDPQETKLKPSVINFTAPYDLWNYRELKLDLSDVRLFKLK